MSGEQGEEAAFLTEIRTPEKEAERLERIQNEFIRGFRSLPLAAKGLLRHSSINTTLLHYMEGRAGSHSEWNGASRGTT